MRSEAMTSTTFTEKHALISLEQLDTQIMGFLQGKVLTIVDASYSDVVQRDAVKSLIKQTFSSQVEWIKESVSEPRINIVND